MRELLLNQHNRTKELRQLSLFFALLLLPMGVWGQTDYGLTVAGVDVTSENAANIIGDNIQGTVSFDVQTSALTLEGATITGNIVVNNLTSLTINVVGENTINAGASSAIQSNVATTACALTFQRGSDLDCSLALNSEDVTVISTGFSTPGYQALALVVEGLSEDYTPDYYSLYGLSYYDWQTQSNQPITSATITSYTTYDIIVNGEQVTNLNMNAICKGQVGTGHIAFDGEHTLTLNEVPNIVFDGTYPFIQTSMDLTINLVGNSDFNCGNTTFITRLPGDNDNHTVTFTTDANNPGMLSLTVGDQFDGFDKAFENGLEWKPEGYYSPQGTYYPAAWVAIPFTEYGITVGGVAVTSANASDIRGDGFDAYKVSYSPATKTLSLENAFFEGGVSTNDDLTISAIGSNTIYGDVTSSKNGGATLTIRKGETDEGVTLNLSPSSSDPTGFSSVVYDNMYLSDENDRDVVFSPTRQRFEKNEWQTAEVVSFTSDVTYDLWLGGTKVTEENKDNVLGTVDAEPTVTFNPEGNILTLNNMSLSSTSIYNSGIISRLSALTIVVNGNNTITNNDSCTAIRADAPMAQTLTIQRGSADNCSLAFNSYRPIRNFNTLTVTDLYWNDTFTYGYDETLTSDDPGYRLMKGDNEEASVNEATGFVPTLGDPTRYKLTVGGVQVTSANADDVLGDGTVSFTQVIGQTQEIINILTLTGATLTQPVKVGLANLTFDIHGTNTITTDETCIQNTATTVVPSLTFKSVSDEVGNLIMTNNNDTGISEIGQGNISISKELAVLLTVYGTDDYTSNLYYITDGSTTVAKIVPSYGVSIDKDASGKTDIYAGNAADVFGDGTVSFDKATSTLTLKGADRGALSTSLAELTIELVGDNTLTEGNYPVLRSSYGDAVTIEIKSTAEVKGSLTMNMSNTEAGNFCEEQVTLNIVAPLEVVSGSLTGNDGDNNTVVIGPNYGITITSAGSSYPITSDNRLDVLGDGGSVQFDGKNTLILNNAWISSVILGADDSWVKKGLTIYLKGDVNNIGEQEQDGLIYQGQGANVPLTFATGDVEPGKLTLSYSDQPLVGFTPTYLNNLTDMMNPDLHQITIAVSMEPFVTQSEEEKTVDGRGVGLGQDIENAETSTLTAGILVNKILYILPDDADGCMPEDNKKVVAINSSMTDAEANTIMAAVINGTLLPGTPGFAAIFKGMTFLLPAGNGDIILDVNTNQSGELHVKVGNNDPVVISGTTGFEERRVPYALTEASYVFIYNVTSAPSSSRRSAGHRAPGRKETTTVGIKGLSVSASDVSPAPGPALSPKKLDKSLLVKEGNHITVKDMDVEDIEVDAFDELSGDITYVDLRQTSIKGMSVNRMISDDLFKKLPEKTFIYLPAGNEVITGTKNVVVGSVCNDMELDAAAPFEASKDFVAVKAVHARDFSTMLDKHCTVYLPFALDEEQASSLGTFYEMTGIADGKIMFTSVKETKANMPYMFKPAKKTVSAKMVEVKATIPGAPVVGSATFEGTYDQKSILSDASTQYYCFKAEDGILVHVIDNSMTVDPFRCYIKVTGGASLGRFLDIVVDDETTAVKNIKVGSEDNVYYDLSGRRVLYPKKGMYIMNGKKVIIK